MTHLQRDELRRWHEEGPAAERERVLGHLAGCDTCRVAYAALVRDNTPSAAADLTREAVPLGLRALPPPPAAPARTFGVPAWALSGMAALVVLAAAVMVLRPGPLPSPLPSAVVRGDEIQPLAPDGPTSGPVAFRWSSPLRAARFRVTVRDEVSHAVYEAAAAEERLAPGVFPLTAGRTFVWSVEALDEGGAVLIRSPERRFTLAAR